VELQLRQLQGLSRRQPARQARTQSSIAISDDGVHWVLCNASPDIRAQLQSFAPMQPAAPCATPASAPSS
jgi:phosphoribosyl 1,2-cyclic phosphodiesterase